MIEWTKQAVIQLEQARDFISRSNREDGSDKMALRIVLYIGQLDQFPMSGRTGRVVGTRERIITNTPFIAAYAIDQHRIVVLALYHGAQGWPKVL